MTDPRAKQGQLLAGRPVVLATVRGGGYGTGTPREGWDHSIGYLRRMLADVWGGQDGRAHVGRPVRRRLRRSG